MAEPIKTADLPAAEQNPDIVHLAPIAGEATADLFQPFPRSLRCVTLQGLMRIRDADGAVRHRIGEEAEAAAAVAEVAVFSLDDVDGDAREAQRLAECCRMTAVTDGPRGCHIFRERQVRHYPAPSVAEADPTGAGDIFAAIFFLRLWETNDPDKAAWMATQLASRSVTRRGLLGIPGGREIDQAKR